MAKPKILIVGAGPCGLTAALELARRGYHPRIIDKAPGSHAAQQGGRRQSAQPGDPGAQWRH